MSINHECQCDDCKKGHQHDKCNCHMNHHHHDQCKCQKNDHQHDKCQCQKNHHHCEKKDTDCCHHEKYNDCFENRCFNDDRFVVRLGGLTSGMAFRLRQLIDCDINIVVSEGNEKIQGKLVYVGTDFVEVVKNAPDKKGIKGNKKCGSKKESRIVPFESIKFIENLD